MRSIHSRTEPEANCTDCATPTHYNPATQRPQGTDAEVRPCSQTLLLTGLRHDQASQRLIFRLSPGILLPSGLRSSCRTFKSFIIRACLPSETLPLDYCIQNLVHLNWPHDHIARTGRAYGTLCYVGTGTRTVVRFRLRGYSFQG